MAVGNSGVVVHALSGALAFFLFFFVFPMAGGMVSVGGSGGG